MKLQEVIETLLKAEDEAGEMHSSAEREAKEIIRKARDKFTQEQEANLSAAREEAQTQVELSRQTAEMEALHIAELSERAMEKMRDHFDKKAPELIAGIAEKVALEYAAHGRI